MIQEKITIPSCQSDFKFQGIDHESTYLARLNQKTVSQNYCCKKVKIDFSKAKNKFQDRVDFNFKILSKFKP